MSLYDDPPHRVDIHLPAAPTKDDGGGVILNWSALADQSSVSCTINTSGASIVNRQGQGTITVNNRISFKASTVTAALVQGSKLIETGTGRVFIMQGLERTRTYGRHGTSGIPAFIYVVADEIL